LPSQSGLSKAFLSLIVGIINEITRKNKKHVSEKVGVLHALNSILPMFSPSIYSVRLHLVKCVKKIFQVRGRGVPAVSPGWWLMGSGRTGSEGASAGSFLFRLTFWRTLFRFFQAGSPENL